METPPVCPEAEYNEIDFNVIIGIDFGSTSSVVSYYRLGELVTLSTMQALSAGVPSKTFASSIYLNEQKNQLYVGHKAKPFEILDPPNSIINLKKKISEKCYFEKDEEVKKSRILLSELFRMLKLQVQLKINCRVKYAVLTVPAYFSESARHIFKDSARLCGLEVLRILNEPTAASVYYTHLYKKESICALFVDVGGLTVDMTVCNIMLGVTDVLATAGDPSGGTFLIDDQVFEFLLKQIKVQNQQLYTIIRVNPSAKRKLLQLSEQLKIQFCDSNMYSISKSILFEVNDVPYYISYVFNKDDLQKCFEPFLKKFNRLFQELESKKSLFFKGSENIDKLILIGAPGNSPYVRDLVYKCIGIPIEEYFCSITSVSKGAALYGALINGVEAEINVLSDVASLPIGIGVQGEVFEVVIPSNTKLPCKKLKLFTTTEDFQSKVKVSIFEGPRLIATQNNFLGEVLLEGIQMNLRGEPTIAVALELNEEGVLDAYVQDQKTKVQKKLRIYSTARLLPEQVQELKKISKKYVSKDYLYTSIMKIRQELKQLFRNSLMLSTMNDIPAETSKAIGDLTKKYHYILKVNYKSLHQLSLLKSEILSLYRSARSEQGESSPMGIRSRPNEKVQGRSI